MSVPNFVLDIRIDIAGDNEIKLNYVPNNNNKKNLNHCNENHGCIILTRG